MAEPFVPPDTGGAQAWAPQIEIRPRTGLTLTVDEGTLEPLIASASEAGLTTMMLFLTRARGFAPCSRIRPEGDAGPRIQDALTQPHGLISLNYIARVRPNRPWRPGVEHRR